MTCRCFWWENNKCRAGYTCEDGRCLVGNDGNQETCPDHRERTNPATGEAWGKVQTPEQQLIANVAKLDTGEEQ